MSTPIETDVTRPDLEVHHEADAARYVLHRAGERVGTLAYRTVGGGTVDVYSTNISPSARGQGLGAVLVQVALDEFRARGTSVAASCWYVADFLEANPEYQDLRPGA